MNDNIYLELGDCLDVLKTIDDNSIDSIVTDPPYGIKFMGKKWDYDVPSVEIWEECLRVLKPGGYLLSFAGTKTQHRMAVNIEDAGFEIRDMIAWLYGSGFPKSHNVSKAIDKAGGVSPKEQAHILKSKREIAGLSQEELAEIVGCTKSSIHDWEEGRARAKGSSLEYMIPSVEYRAKLADTLGYTEDERRRSGTVADRRGDGTVIGLGHSGNLTTGGHTGVSEVWEGWGTALKPAMEPITMARKPLDGTVACNVLEHGTGALNIDDCRIGYAKSDDPRIGKDYTHNAKAGLEIGDKKDNAGGEVQRLHHQEGRWPANVIHDGSEEVMEAFPDAKGQQGSLTGKEPSGKMGHANCYGRMDKRHESTPRVDDGTSAARFYYCAKASKKDRGEGNTHPTVKPTDLMRYLCRLVTPPGGIVLDPFMGSGSTGKGALLEGFQFVGIEKEKESYDIAKFRIGEIVSG